MAHSLSAKKRIRQSIKRRARNRARRDLVKDQVKSFISTLSGSDVNKAKTEMTKTVQRLDKVAAKGTIHKNTAARKRSRLQKKLNAFVASGGKPAVVGKGGKAAKA